MKIAYFNTDDKPDRVIDWYIGNNGKFAIYYYKDNPQERILADLIVDEYHRRSGRGNAMMDYIESHFDGLILKVACGSWQEAWYRRRGWTNYGDNNDGEYLWLTQPEKQGNFPAIVEPRKRKE